MAASRAGRGRARAGRGGPGAGRARAGRARAGRGLAAYRGEVTRIEAIQGDITHQRVDAIVNAANSSLLGGGGVDGAIHRAAGPGLLAECRALRAGAYRQGLPVGQAVATGAGRLPCRWVIHTVGPNWTAGQCDEADLARCFTASLAEAVRVGARTLAAPAVSAGVYGWAPDTVARVAVDAVRGSADGDRLDLVRFVLFGADLLGHFQAALAT